MTSRDRILVGVNGSAGSAAAIRFATREAALHDATLHLVHVVPQYVQAAPRTPARYEFTAAEVEQKARAILADAASLAQQRVAAWRVTTALRHGDPARTLVDDAQRASVLVLGDERLPALERLAQGSTVDGAVGHCPVPLVVVGSEWADSSAKRVVAAGIRSARSSSSLIETALRTARARRARLVLVNAWDLAGVDEGADPARERAEWMEEEWRAIAEAAEPLRRRYSDVDIEIRVAHGRPAEVLREVSHESDLLLLTRAPRPDPAGHFGETGRAVVRATGCPVAVLPPPPPVRASDALPSSECEEGVPDAAGDGSTRAGLLDEPAP